VYGIREGRSGVECQICRSLCLLVPAPKDPFAHVFFLASASCALSFSTMKLNGGRLLGS
jgi:hypothetical protein